MSPFDLEALATRLVEGFAQRGAAWAAHLPALLAAVLVLVAAGPVARFARRSARRAAAAAQLRPSAEIIVGRLARWGVLVGAALVALMLAVPGFTPAGLIGTLGIGSVAVGFAFKDILQNFLAGLILLLREPFRVGDQIVVGGYEGTVEDVELRATHLRTYDGRRVVIPNVTVFGEAVTVNTAYPARRSELDVGIAYGADIGAAKAAILTAIAGVEEVLGDPAPDVVASALGESAVVLTVRWWTDSRRGAVVSSGDAVLLAVKRALDAAAIEIPFPIRTIRLAGALAGVGDAAP